jgi:uncharacterized protein YndB with AHSA1/START domain
MPTRRLTVKMKLRIAKPPRVVYEAIADPARMAHYFISSGSGRLDGGSAVTWQFADVGAKLIVTPKKCEAHRRISFAWSASKTETTVDFRFEPQERAATRVSVAEIGWPATAKGIAQCMGQTRGWAHMLSCLKAYLEHGINLRQGGTLK